MKCLTCGTEMICKSDNGMGIDFVVCERCDSKANILHNNDGSIYKAEWFKGDTFMYTLGLRCGGLMEDPDWHIEFVKSVYAKDLKEAKDKWANITKQDINDDWNPKSQTVWGWGIFVLRSNDKRIEEKDYFRG